MYTRNERLPLENPAPNTHWLSSSCCLQADGDLRTVIVGGAPILKFDVNDQLMSRFAAAMIAESRLARVKAVMQAFGMDDATLYRTRIRWRKLGLAGLLNVKSGPKGPWKILAPVERRIVELWREGKTQTEIERRLGVSQRSVGRVLRRKGISTEDRDETQHLPFGTVETETATNETPTASDETPNPVEPEAKACGNGSRVLSETDAPLAQGSDRELPTEALPAGTMVAPMKAEAHEQGETTMAPQEQRYARANTPEMAVAYAMLGMAPDGEAEVVFESRRSVENAGVLLAIPVLAATGVLEAARRVYGRLRDGIYGLRATMLVLVAMTMLRRPRQEALKETDPVMLGDVLGLARVPEVKTVRRKLSEIAQAGRAHELIRQLGQKWLKEREDALGILYVDGHVRVYHGEKRIPKTHVAQRNKSMPATTDYWVNDVMGGPVFVVTAEANAAMTKVLPGLLKEIDELGELPNLPNIKGTVVFDRGGWSLELFKKLILERGWDILTYRKGKREMHPLSGFEVQRMTIDGRSVEYMLSERQVQLCKGLVMREIAELHEDGGQTIFLTSHFDHPAVLLAYRMFGRWRQENYFKYMKANFDLDALVEYGAEFDDPTREVPNPAYKAMTKELKKARVEVADLEAKYGAAAADNKESKRRTMRGFKIANGEIGQALRAARNKVTELEIERRKLPRRVPVSEALKGEPVLRLKLEKKMFTDAIKSAAYRAETILLNLLRPHYSRAADEGRAFLRNAVQQTGDLQVDGDEVVVQLAPMSAPRYTAALRALCEELNRLAPTFPETTYRLRYEVRAEPVAR